MLDRSKCVWRSQRAGLRESDRNSTRAVRRTCGVRDREPNSGWSGATRVHSPERAPQGAGLWIRRISPQPLSTVLSTSYVSLAAASWYVMCKYACRSYRPETITNQEKLMISIFRRHAKFDIPNALRRSHDNVRTNLARAAAESGPITPAANRLAKLCLPHFRWEERTLFPALGLLPDLARGHVCQEMQKVLPMIAEFSARQDALNKRHRSIVQAIDAFAQAAQRDGNRGFAEFAYDMKVHEWIEDEVVFPIVVVIGKYLRGKLADQQPEQNDCTLR
jgi:hypothetical protein